MFIDRAREENSWSLGRRGLMDPFIDFLAGLDWRGWLGRMLAGVAGAGKRLSLRIPSGGQATFSGANRCLVSCPAGTLWITAEGQGRDVVLSAGQSVELWRPGLVVITGGARLSEARVWLG